MEVTILEGLGKVGVFLLLHGGCGVLQHPGCRVVARTHLICSQPLEVVNQVFGALPKWPTVQGTSTTLEQQQVIKRLQQQAVIFEVPPSWGPREGGGGVQGAYCPNCQDMTCLILGFRDVHLACQHYLKDKQAVPRLQEEAVEGSYDAVCPTAASAQ